MEGKFIICYYKFTIQRDSKLYTHKIILICCKISKALNFISRRCDKDISLTWSKHKISMRYKSKIGECW
jgi:hypothetical protein